MSTQTNAGTNSAQPSNIFVGGTASSSAAGFLNSFGLNGAQASQQGGVAGQMGGSANANIFTSGLTTQGNVVAGGNAQTTQNLSTNVFLNKGLEGNAPSANNPVTAPVTPPPQTRQIVPTNVTNQVNQTGQTNQPKFNI